MIAARSNPARIGRVRMKNGGADVRVLRSSGIASDMGRDMTRSAGEIARMQGDELTGFVIVAWNDKAEASTSFSLSDFGVVHPEAAVHFVARHLSQAIGEARE